MKFYLIVALIVAINNINAAVITSNGTGGGDWATGASWAGGVAPGAADDAIIAPGDIITITSNRSVTNVTLNGSINFTTNTRTLTVSGNLTTTGNGVIIGGGTNRIMNVAGVFTIPSGNSVDIGGISLTVTGIVTLDGALSFSTSNAGTKTFSTNLIVNNGASVAFNIAEALNVNGSLTANGTCNLLAGTINGSFNVNGTTTFAAGSTVTLGVGTLATTGTGTINGAVIFTSATGNKNFLGDLTINSGSIIDFSTAETLQVSGNLVVNGTVSVTGTATGIVNVSTNATISSGAIVSWDRISWTVAGVLTFDGSVTHTSATGTSNFNSHVIINNGGSLVFNAARVTNIAGNCSLFPGSMLGNGTAVGDLNITGNLIINTGGASISNMVDIDLTGNVDISGTAVLDASAGGLIIDLLGNWLNYSTAADPFVETGSTILFSNPTVAQLITVSGVKESFYTMRITNSSGLSPSVTTNKPIDVTNEFDITAGVFELAGNDLTISNSGSASVTCTFSNSSIVGTGGGSDISISDGFTDFIIIDMFNQAIGSAVDPITLITNTGRACFEELELYGVGDFTKTLNTDDVCGGGNIYHNNVTFTATSSASRWRFGNGTTAVGDRFEANATFNANANGGTNNNFIIGANSTGNEYFGTTTFTSTTIGGFYIGRSNGGTAPQPSGHTFHGPVVINVSFDGVVVLGDAATDNPSTIICESTVQLNSLASSTGDIYIGSASGASTVSFNVNGRIIDGTILGATNIYFNSITQNTFLANNTTSAAATNSAIYVGNGAAANACLFNGNLTLTSPNISLRGSTFNGVNTFQANGATNFTSYGGNTFNGVTTFTNNGTGYWRLSNSAVDDFNANATFTQLSTGVLAPAYNFDNTFSRNLITSNTNAITFGSGGGRVIMDGSSNQDIIGVSGFSPTWVRGRINNTVGDVDLNIPLTITNNLDFVDGIFNTSSTNLLTFNAGSSVSSVSNNSYVDGPVRKIGNTSFTFPVGDNGFYAQTTIGAPSVATDAFTAQYFNVDPNTPGFNTSSKVASLDHLSTCEYWTVDRNAGTSNVLVTLSWDTRSCGVTVPADLRVARWDGSMWQNHGNGGTTTVGSAGTVVTSAVVTSFSPFTLASSTSSNPLPVQLISFDAVPTNQKNVVCNWQTAAEINNHYFTVEKSKDGLNYELVGKVDGQGTVNTSQAYQLVDLYPYNGLSFYRLSQTDFDGKLEVFDPIPVLLNSVVTANIYPNPARDLVTLQFNDIESSFVEVIITDLTGKLVYSKRLRYNAGIVVINNLNLSAGSYLLKSSGHTFKLIIE